MKHKSLFWGIVLLTIGALFLFKGFGLLWFNWFSILRLWPLLLIIWGISLIPVKGFIKFISYLVIIAIGVIFIYRSDRCEDYNFRFNRHFHRSYKYDRDFYDDDSVYSKQVFYKTMDSLTDEAELRIDAAAGFYMLKGKTDSLAVIKTVGNTLEYEFSDRKFDNKNILKFSIEDNHIRRFKNKNNVYINLNTKPVWNFDIDAGAAKINFDLSEYKTKSIDIEGGASDVMIKLGDKYYNTKVDIDSGVSSITIKIPEGSGCKIESEIVLSSRHFQGFDRIRRGLYKTPDFDEKDNKIYISIDGAVSSFNILRY